MYHSIFSYSSMLQFPVHDVNRFHNGETTSVWSQESMQSLESREITISAGDVVRRLNESLNANGTSFKVKGTKLISVLTKKQHPEQCSISAGSRGPFSGSHERTVGNEAGQNSS